VGGFIRIRWMIGKPWPAHRYASPDGFACFEMAIAAKPQHRLVITRPERQDMTTMQCDSRFTVRIPHFRNNKSSGTFAKD
jgi:hypothetical protein